MFYLLERSESTGKFETNLTMYGNKPEDILDRVFPDGLYYRDGHEHGCGMSYTHITTGKQIGIIYSMV